MTMVFISDIVGPRQVVAITTRANIEILGKSVSKDNIMIADWHTQLSFNPLLYGILIGKTRYTLNLIKKSKAFCVNFIPYRLKEKIINCGKQRGEHIDKFKENGLEKEECEKIDCPRLKEAIAFLECEVINEIETGDHILFIGKVLNSFMNKEEKRLYHITGDKFVTMK